jgi:chemotaxis protein methyltransferase CheR
VDQRHFRFWSAGCSTGAEPYTLAMLLSEFAEKHGAFRYTVLGTDISQKVLKEAIQGVYEAQMAAPIPQDLRKKYLLRSKDRRKSVVRVAPEIRAVVKFRQLNFMDEDYGLRQSMDIVFCRNVLIYFDRPTQERVINRICHHLLPGGYLFIGHSETLNGLDIPLTQVKATIYRRKGRA